MAAVAFVATLAIPVHVAYALADGSHHPMHGIVRLVGVNAIPVLVMWALVLRGIVRKRRRDRVGAG